jgi:exosortase
LIYTEWPALNVDRKPSDPLGLLVMIPGAVALCWGKLLTGSDARMFWGMLGLVTWWLGTFIACFGRRAFWSLLFPLSFLFWLIPIPEVTLNKTIALWQHGSALSASWLFSAIGVPVAQDGIFISIPGLNLEVAQECSSVRSSLMLIVTSMVLAHLFLRSFWRQAAVVMVASPLSIAKNGVRIFAIAMLGTRVDPAFLNGNLHRHGGVLFFLLALFALLLLLWLLNRIEAGAHRTRLTSAPVQRL